ncbi:MAG: DUF4349 domain-containing protein [Anaerolineae bacterium]
MKRIGLITALFIALAVVAGCSAFSSRASMPDILTGNAQSKATDTSGALPYPAAPTAAAAAPAAPPAPSGGMSSSESQNGGSGTVPGLPAQAPVDQMIVYNGSLRLEVQDTEATVTKISDVLKASQGYISNRSLDRDSKGIVTGSITIRVPASSLDAVLNQIRALGLKVLHEDAKSEDVTQEYTDLDARRRNLEAYEVELTKLLDTMRQETNKAADLLAIYNQLTEVRGQIEQIKGRQNYLQNVSALATYTIEFVPHQDIQVVEPEGWNPGTTAKQALRSLVQALQALGDIAINLFLFLLPVLIILALPFVIVFWIVRRWWRNRRTGRQAATT